MSDQYGEYEEYSDETEEPQQQPQQRSNSEWAALRKEKRARGKAEEERNQAQRSLAFMQAGIDPADARLGYFVRGYTGEVNPTAIKAAAVSAGFVAENAGPSLSQQQALGAQQRTSTVAAAPQSVDGSVDAQAQALTEAYAQGGSAGVLAKMAELGIPITAT